MSNTRRWEDVKAEAHRLHSEMADSDHRAVASAGLDAFVPAITQETTKVAGHDPRAMAAALGFSVRISQIETGDIEAMEVETLRAYAAALGGRIDVTISVGPRSVKVA